MRRSFWSMVVVLAVGAGCRGWESEQPPVHLVPNMDTQDKGKAYRKDPSGLFEDGRAMRLPVEGTVAVGHLDEDSVLHDGVGTDTQPTLAYPTAVKEKLDDAFRARGHNRYQVYCSPCHGINGDGKGPVAARGLTIPPPSLLDQRLKDMPVGKIYAAIKNGVNNGNMGSYAAQIPVHDRWAIVSYVRQLQMKADPNVQEEGGENIVVAAATSASADHGSVLFKAKGCNACHSLDGNRLVGPSFKGLWGSTSATNAGDVVVDKAYLKESITQPNAKIVNGFPPAMPPLPLSDVEVDSLILFIETQK